MHSELHTWVNEKVHIFVGVINENSDLVEADEEHLHSIQGDCELFKVDTEIVTVGNESSLQHKDGRKILSFFRMSGPHFTED